MTQPSAALYPLMPAAAIPAVTGEQMREIDRLAMQDAGVSLLQMLENAGRALALVVRDQAPDAAAAEIIVLAGRGNNGAGALAAARHLRGWGYDPQVVLTVAPSALEEAAAHQHHTLHRDGLRALWPGAPEFDTRFPEELAQTDVVVDGLVGYGLTGPLQGDVAVLAEAVLDRVPPAVVSLDIPSGFDATTGEVHSFGIVATTTVSLGLPKTGLWLREAAAAVGDVVLADIGIPNYIYERLGLTRVRGIYAEGPLLRLLATEA